MFQKKIIEKYLSKIEKDLLGQKYALFCSIFKNDKKIENIKASKEEQYQEGFIRDLFVSVLGYTIKPEPDYNIFTEAKNEVKNKNNARKSDGAICDENNENRIRAVIELKGTDTTVLDKVSKQAFDYKSHHENCNYVIVSNFERLRIYVETQIEFEEFDLFTLSYERFCVLYLLLELNQLRADIPLKLKHETLSEEKAITDSFYKDYSTFKRLLFEDLIENNPNTDKFLLFKKTQKLLDRILFILFCEDRNLLPANSIANIVKSWEKSRTDMFGMGSPLYDYFRRFFSLIDKGYKNPTDKANSIFAYNGGLFKSDEVLDTIKVGDDVLYIHTKKLSDYDFESQISVDILGRIFENSLTEIEEVQREIEAEKNGEKVDNNNVGKRKKDGVFYTPEYITKYIVENTIGKLCEEKRTELKINDEDFSFQKKLKTKEIEELNLRLQNYRAWLLQLKILDPACGSGAFLNAALHELREEHRLIDRLWEKLHPNQLNFENIDNTILENNLYGVDINEESVEIAKLSLWLHTAKKDRKLTTLNTKIKCGNSLIDDPAVAGEKAFNWEKEFPEVFGNSRDKGFQSLVSPFTEHLCNISDIEKDDIIYHVTTATHNSHYSEKILFFNDGAIGKPVNLSFDEEVFVMETIERIIVENNYKVLAYNFCKDHLHFLVACKKDELPKIMQKIKGITSLERNKKFNPSDRQLWAQKYFEKVIYNDEYLANTIHYVVNNRKKHNLKEFCNEANNCDSANDTPTPNGLKSIGCRGILGCRGGFDGGMGGFDVVIGNPPYVRAELLSENDLAFYRKNYDVFTPDGDLFSYFYEKGMNLLKSEGLFGFISNTFDKTTAGKVLRDFVANKTQIFNYVDFTEVQVFQGATTYPIILLLKKSKIFNEDFIYKKIPAEMNGKINISLANEVSVSQKSLQNCENWSFESNEMKSIISKISSYPSIYDKYGKCFYGVKTALNEAFFIDENTKKCLIEEDTKSSDLIKNVFEGKDLNKWTNVPIEKYILLVHNGYEALEAINIENYPAIKKYLSQFYEKLEKRYDKGKTPYNLRNCAYQGLFGKSKIIWGNLQNSNKFSYDKNGIIISAPCCMLPSEEKSLVSILNSKIVWKYLTSICVVRNGGYIEVKPQYFEKIPIPPFEDNTQLNELTDKMLSLNETFQKKSSNFIKVVKQTFALKKVSAKMENFYELDFDGFVKELKQKATPKLKLEWLEVFEDSKKELLELKQQIDSTDSAINALVYRLYGLSDEEIRIVEEK